MKRQDLMKDLRAEARSNEPSFIEVDSNEETRCPNCSKLFAKGTMGSGTKLEYKCPRCKELVKFEKL